MKMIPIRMVKKGGMGSFSVANIIFMGINFAINLQMNGSANAFSTSALIHKPYSFSKLSMSSSSSSTTNTKNLSKSVGAGKPRTGIGQSLLNLALNSPIWKNILVPQARSTMVKTAEANGIPWSSCKQWIQSQPGPWSSDYPLGSDKANEDLPLYYQQPFHAYEEGNLSWDAAFEQEIASCAVGARNFPKFGYLGEDAFRSSFEGTLIEKCQAQIVTVSDNESNSKNKGKKAIVVDMGCGTGISTRRLASLFPSHNDEDEMEFIGIDLSPYFVSVGSWLLENQPKSFMDNGPWVNTISNDKRISYQVGDITNLPFISDDSVNVVNIMFVFHEMPLHVIKATIEEAYRVLTPGGQLWICEMDFESPAYAAQRDNPMLFSLLRATEPYLDDYADGMPSMRQYLAERFENVVIEAATGRHYALVATKGQHQKQKDKDDDHVCVMEDRRFNPDGSYVNEDTHLMLWESKDKSIKN